MAEAASWTAVIISIISLWSSLRKMEYGEFYLNINNEKQDFQVLLNLIKSDVFNIEIHFPSTAEDIRVEVDLENNSNFYFSSSQKPKIAISNLKEKSTLVVTNYTFPIILKYEDRYKNKYSQTILNKESITIRQRKNLRITL
jgi:hypothetical protein